MVVPLVNVDLAADPEGQAAEEVFVEVTRVVLVARVVLGSCLLLLIVDGILEELAAAVVLFELILVDDGDVELGRDEALFVVIFVVTAEDTAEEITDLLVAIEGVFDPVVKTLLIL